MMRNQNYIKLFILTVSIMSITMVCYPLYAQSYNEVNVYGWGLALNEGAPAITDLDNDGYLDLLIGHRSGTLWHYEQASGDEFVLISQNFSDIDVQSESMPAFADIDGDSLIDLVIGSNGRVGVYEQESIGGSTFLEISNDVTIGDVGAHLSPTLADINNDGLLDLLVGESLGNMVHFIQDSLHAWTFTEVDHTWLDWDGGIYVSPSFTDLENDGILDLMVGTSDGKIIHLIQDSLYASTFTEINTNFAGIDVGQSAKPLFFEIDDDDKMDLFIGEWYYGLFHYEQNAPASDVYQLLSDDILGARDFGAKNGYAVADIDNDGLLDMLVATHYGLNDEPINHLEQTTEGNLLFSMVEERFNDISVGQYTRLALYDINGNGLLDLFIGDVFGKTSRYEQVEVNSYSFALIDEQFNNAMQTKQPPQLAFEDIDNDGLLDMIVGSGWGTLYHYVQDSVNAVTFSQKSNRFADLDVGFSSSPVFTDIDGDAHLDLIVGNSGGKLYYLEQDSINALDFTTISTNFGDASVMSDALPCFADINLDGNVDLLVGDFSGGISLFLRNDDEDLTPPLPPENLTASINGESVDLTWSPSLADDLMLYNIYRSTRYDTTVSEYLNSTPVGITSYVDSSLQQSDVYYYWITAFDSIGNESAFSQSDSVDIEVVSSISEHGINIHSFQLCQNYPNPFNPVTTINYELPVTNYVDLSIYNLLGQKIVTLVSGKQSAGTYKVEWDASDYPSGIYIYRLLTDKGSVESKKLILLK